MSVREIFPIWRRSDNQSWLRRRRTEACWRQWRLSSWQAKELLSSERSSFELSMSFCLIFNLFWCSLWVLHLKFVWPRRFLEKIWLLAHGSLCVSSELNSSQCRTALMSPRRSLSRIFKRSDLFLTGISNEREEFWRSLWYYDLQRHA